MDTGKDWLFIHPWWRGFIVGVLPSLFTFGTTLYFRWKDKKSGAEATRLRQELKDEVSRIADLQKERLGLQEKLHEVEKEKSGQLAQIALNTKPSGRVTRDWNGDWLALAERFQGFAHPVVGVRYQDGEGSISWSLDFGPLVESGNRAQLKQEFEILCTTGLALLARSPGVPEELAENANEYRHDYTSWLDFVFLTSKDDKELAGLTQQEGENERMIQVEQLRKLCALTCQHWAARAF